MPRYSRSEPAVRLPHMTSTTQHELLLTGPDGGLASAVALTVDAVRPPAAATDLEHLHARYPRRAPARREEPAVGLRRPTMQTSDLNLSWTGGPDGGLASAGSLEARAVGEPAVAERLQRMHASYPLRGPARPRRLTGTERAAVAATRVPSQRVSRSRGACSRPRARRQARTSTRGSPRSSRSSPDGEGEPAGGFVAGPQSPAEAS